MNKNSWVNSTTRLLASDSLSHPFIASVTKREDFKVGIELEQFLVDSKTFKLLPFEGEKSITSIFAEFQSQYHWKAVEEQGKVIALERDEFSITLEPGGAFEFVSAPHRTVHEINAAIESFEAELSFILNKFKISAPVSYTHLTLPTKA